MIILIIIIAAVNWYFKPTIIYSFKKKTIEHVVVSYSSQDRALEAMEHTLAELWIPRRRIGKGPGQPPQLACTGWLRGRATQVETEHWTRRNTRSQSWLWIPRKRIGKGTG